MEILVFEIGIAIALLAFAGFVSNKLRSSIVPFYIIVGMLVGPHAPHFGILDLRFIQSADIIEFMGRIGVLFLLFYLGLEFSVGRLIKAGRSIVIGGTIYLAINFTLGLAYAIAAGFPAKEVMVMAGITTISSSAIVAKVLVDLKRTANPETEMILGIIMFEDIFLAIYISILSGLLLSGATSILGVIGSAAISLFYILGMLLIGRKITPFLNKFLAVQSNELFILLVFSSLFLIAGFSETIHVAEAIGALLAGLILAETEHMKRIEHMILPFRDFFGALFFFSFGLSIDPFNLGGAVWLAVGAVIITILGNLIAGLLAGKSAGLSSKASTNIGLTIVSRGEFSIITANLGKAGGLLPILQPFAALYVLLLAILGPLLTKESKTIYTWLNKIFKFDNKRLAK
ncbi:K(+)/H(+) antiporter YhaU [Propionispora sp. 2/2-37]|uniref:cation:proton antiporter n=1 Tax=Propionispora sp. 2/2-37 TaxID=1677858 RepID=UPI0006BB9028|nr:cation:proton antiporter [Propionispora sp. 2/2-37]CUH95075.1 K(+)/H(+) antiporter YhaU [Propionispora sp. 2/2-37]